MSIENNHNHNGGEGIVEQRHKLSPEQVESIVDRVLDGLEESEKKLLSDELEYFVIAYPNKTVYVPKWTCIPHAENISGDARHPHYVFVNEENIEDVLRREVQSAVEAFAEAKKSADIDKIRPIE